MMVESGKAMRRDDNRAKPSLWLTGRASKRALIEVSVFMICPLPVNAAAATLAVYTFRFFEVSLAYLPAPPRLCSGYGKLRWYSAQYRISIEQRQSVEKQGSTSPFSSLNELKSETILNSAGTSGRPKNSTTLPAH